MFDSSKLDLAEAAESTLKGRVVLDGAVWDAWMQALLPGCLRMQFEAWSPEDVITQGEIRDAVQLADKTMQAALRLKRDLRSQGGLT